MARYTGSKRVWVDVDTFKKLNRLFDITRGYIRREKIFDEAIREWKKSNGNKRVGNIILNDDTSKMHRMWIVVEEDLWEDFKILCNRYDVNVDINVGFKIAIYRFIDSIENDPRKLLEYCW